MPHGVQQHIAAAVRLHLKDLSPKRMAGSMLRFGSSPIIRHLGGSSFKAARTISGLSFQ
jgi:hypothetical protein